ncbi:MAG TPA: hypothetical protein VLK29_04690 [Luteimonas sp.]|nr:hypothetical protein [Luteimonas sp.]
MALFHALVVAAALVWALIGLEIILGVYREYGLAVFLAHPKLLMLPLVGLPLLDAFLQSIRRGSCGPAGDADLVVFVLTWAGADQSGLEA